MKRLSKIALFLISALAFVACSQHEPPTDPERKQTLRPVKTIIISAGQKHDKSFPGVVDAAQTAEIGFRVSGELKEVLIKEGQHVATGQTLARLDQTDFKINLKAAKSEYDRAKADFTRAEKLKLKGLISQADIDKLKSQLSNARSQRDSAEQNLKYTELKAPFDGVVAKTYLSNFEKVSPTEKFAAIQDHSAFEVKIDIPESIMIKLNRNERSREIYATFDGFSERRFPLTFKEISTRADEKTQTYAIRFIMEAPSDITILPGMSTTVIALENTVLDTDNSIDVYLPAHAVLEDSGGRFVYVANASDEKSVGHIERRSVVVGELDENGINIVQGLLVGDAVVTAGMSKISDGMPVRLLNETRQ